MPALDAVRRLGVFGGSFDPVHRGHLHAARAAVEAFDLDAVVFVPARHPPHKPGRELASGADRLEMLRRAVRGEPRFSVLGLELERSGPSYTIDTVRALPGALGLRPDVAIHLILGSDNLDGFTRWREAEKLVELVQPIVVHRSGEPERFLAEIEAKLGPAAAEKFRAGYLRLPPVPVSSTDLRAKLPEVGTSLDMPREVLEYVRERGLYGVGR